ncbi:MAG: hypothetical protein F6K00_08280 [Leptolyngbya sp. SIOISBB]|nr:hypothetical protein [Leptolyngbya sp. SIOISBB]
MNHDENFQGPPTVWVVTSFIGGIATGLALIYGLEMLGDRLSPVSNLSQTTSATIVRNL